MRGWLIGLMGNCKTGRGSRAVAKGESIAGNEEKKSQYLLRWGLSFEAASVGLATTNKRRITTPVDASDCLKRAWSKSFLASFSQFRFAFLPQIAFRLEQTCPFSFHLLLAIAEEHPQTSTLAKWFRTRQKWLSVKTPFSSPHHSSSPEQPRQTDTVKHS